MHTKLSLIYNWHFTNFKQICILRGPNVNNLTMELEVCSVMYLVSDRCVREQLDGVDYPVNK